MTIQAGTTRGSIGLGLIFGDSVIAHILQDLYSERPCVVVDIGARDGFHMFRGLHPHMDIHAIEPDPLSAEELGKHAGRFGKHNVYPLAIGSGEGERTLYLARRGSMSSLLQPDFDAFKRGFGEMKNAPAWMKSTEIVSSVKVNCTTLEKFHAENVRTFIDFLKIDTQGNELDILKSGEVLLISGEVGVICVEVAMLPVYKKQDYFSDVDVFLRTCGYRLVEFRCYPEAVTREDEFARGEKMYERPRFSSMGDAWYVFDWDNTQTHNKSQRLRSAVILASEGYFSESAYILNGLLNEADQNEIFRSLSKHSRDSRFKHLMKRWTPLAMQQWWARIKK